MRGQSCEALRDHARDNDVVRLIALATTMSRGSRDCACNDDVVSLEEISLATSMSTGLSLLRGQSRKARRDHARDNNVARLIALVTTMLQGSRDCARDNNVARL